MAAEDNPWIEQARIVCERVGITLDDEKMEELADALSEIYDMAVIQCMGNSGNTGKT